MDTSIGDLPGYWGDDVIYVLRGTDDCVARARLMGVSAPNLRRANCLQRGTLYIDAAAASRELSSRAQPAGGESKRVIRTAAAMPIKVAASTAAPGPDAAVTAKSWSVERTVLFGWSGMLWISTFP